MFRGSMVALVTPLDAEQQLDESALRQLVDWHISCGTDGIVIMGTTGEMAMFSPDEQRRAIKVVVDEAKERVPVIAGTGAVSTARSIALTQSAMHAGVDACLLMAPPYVKPTQEGLFQHYRAIAHEVAIPQILYNVPGRTVCDLLPETVARLMDTPNIIGIKEAVADMARVRQLIALADGRIDIYSGDDETALELMLLGGQGVISVTANVAPALMHQMAMHALAGERDSALEINEKLAPLHKTLFLEANPIPVKWAVAKMGKIPQAVHRLPMTVLSDAHHVSVFEALMHAGCAID